MISNKRFRKVGKSRTFQNICDLYKLKDKAVLDIGCGQGQYLAHFGEGSLGVTTAQEEVDFGKEADLPIVFGNAEYLEESLRGEKFSAFWANNLFEHLLSPHGFLMKLKKFSTSDAVLVLGVPVVPKVVSLVRLKWFRGMLASNHINFFTATTLRLTVERAGWRVSSVRPFIFKNNILDRLVAPLAPHLYVIGENDTRFIYPPKKVAEWKDDKRYTDILSLTGQDAK